MLKLLMFAFAPAWALDHRPLTPSLRAVPKHGLFIFDRCYLKSVAESQFSTQNRHQCELRLRQKFGRRLSLLALSFDLAVKASVSRKMNWAI